MVAGGTVIGEVSDGVEEAGAVGEEGAGERAAVGAPPP